MNHVNGILSVADERVGGTHAPSWCKALEPSGFTERRGINDRLFHSVFHSFCEDRVTQTVI
jgi:hypothetical protein